MRRRAASRTAICILTLSLISYPLPVVGASASYSIRKGDTLWRIAKKHHTTVGKLAQANAVRENAVLPLGRSIRIPGVRTQAVTSRQGKSVCSARYRVHTAVGSAILRSGPNARCRRVAMLRAGTNARVLLRQGNWRKIALASGVCGFVYAPLLRYGPAPGAAASSVQEPAGGRPCSSQGSLVRTALACRGMRYQRGGTSRGGFDCSGFTRYIFARYGVSLPHSSAAQASVGTPVAKSELRPGDLVFFQTYRRGISHVGIYAGNGQFVHASHPGRGVRVDSLDSSYYIGRYRGARRVQ